MRFARLLEKNGAQIVAMLELSGDGDFAISLRDCPGDDCAFSCSVTMVTYGGHPREEELVEKLLDDMFYDLAIELIDRADATDALGNNLLELPYDG